ncbi:hypothetical protein ACFL3C_04625 [Patescibacteria group bacterium]
MEKKEPWLPIEVVSSLVRSLDQGVDILTIVNEYTTNFTNLDILRALRRMKVDSVIEFKTMDEYVTFMCTLNTINDPPIDPENISIRDASHDDLEEIEEIYKLSRADIHDLPAFRRKGGIFNPLSEEDLQGNLTHPNYKLRVLEGEGKIIAATDFLLPPGNGELDNIYFDSAFDPVFLAKVESRLRDFVLKNIGKITWIHDLIVHPDYKSLVGAIFMQKTLRAMYEEFGLEYAMSEVWGFYQGEKPYGELYYNIPSTSLLLFKIGGCRFDAVEEKVQIDDVDLNLERYPYLFDIKRLISQGGI